MIIGVPRERKSGEGRIALTPDWTSELVRDGHQVLIETGAGVLSGFTDDEFVAAGATIAASLQEVWGRAELLVKVKEPAPEEIPLFRDGLALFCFLHPAAQEQITRELMARGVTALDYDLLMLDDGRLPILEPMSVIAGKLAVQCGAYALQCDRGGRGVLLGGAPGVAPAEVLVLGAGSAGANAAEVAIGMGASVTIMDINSSRLQSFSRPPFSARTVHSTPRALAREIERADLVVGAVLVPGARAPRLISRNQLTKMKRGSVLVDISIDQGGVAETSRPTTLAEPTYVEEGVVHYCVPNMPAMVPHTSTEALTMATGRWLKQLANEGIEANIRKSAALRSSLITYQGKLTHPVVGEALGIEATPPK
ncbi:MAG: alanine dehydrogenase [Bdellovibrionales bacterium]|nr:alanine dehydrogenase [Bdellovibrionales bacterium]